MLLGVANTLLVLFISRILDGLTGGNISVAQAYISDVTDASNRAKGLGMIGAAFGLGFIFGPALGGFLSQWGYTVPAFVAAGLSLINLALVAFWLPESLTAKKRAELAAGPPARRLRFKPCSNRCAGRLSDRCCIPVSSLGWHFPCFRRFSRCMPNIASI